MKFLFTMFGIYAIILAWGFLLPRDTIQLPEIEREVINPYATDKPDTFIVENPSWVFPSIQENSVTVTIYHAVVEQCDDSPNELASGKKIDTAQAGSYRYCALSRDLLERWNGPYAYGDTIYLEDAGHFSGPWIVQDSMNSRYSDCIDLLVDISTKNYRFEVATIWKEI